MAEIISDAPWTADVYCTGNGNGGGGCRRLIRIGHDDLFNSNTIVRPFVSFACPACAVWTDLRGDDWPPGMDWDEAKMLPERRRVGD